MIAALAMWPGIETDLLDAAAGTALAEVADLVATEPLDLVEAPAAALEPIEVLIGGWGCPKLTAEVLDRLPNLGLLAYGAGTVRFTVTDAVWERGIAVSSAAAANAVPVAEFTVAAITMIAKDVFRVRDRHRAARGASFYGGVGPAGPIGTNGLRVGIVGASKIGRLLIEKLAILDVSVAVADPFLGGAEAAVLGVALMDLDDLCAWANVVTIHAPQLPSTEKMFDAARLAQMVDGAWLVNTARGSLVDTAALEAECSSGRLCAFIDTPDPEPLPATSPLWDLENVVVTPHIAGSIGNEIARMGTLAVAEVRRFAAGEPLLHPVVAADLDRIA